MKLPEELVKLDRLPEDPEGMVGENLEGWAKDPYDENVAEGMLMNLSEQRAIDEAFPNHPLSVIRQLADFIIDNN